MDRVEVTRERSGENKYNTLIDTRNHVTRTRDRHAGHPGTCDVTRGNPGRRMCHVTQGCHFQGRQNVLKLILKSPRFVPFGSNVTHFGVNTSLTDVSFHGCQFDSGRVTVWTRIVSNYQTNLLLF